MSLDPSTFETLSPSRYITFTIPSPSLPPQFLRVAIIDSPAQVAHDSPRVAAMLVPANREQDWIFCTESGLLQLVLNSPGISRLILIANEPTSFDTLVYKRSAETDNNDDALKEKLKPLLWGLSPKCCFKNGIFEVPFFSYEDNVVSNVVIEKCVGSVVGEMVVEDVEVEVQHGECPKTEFRRRLRFKRLPNLVQTEVGLVCERGFGLTCCGIGEGRFVPDVGVLVHPYLAPMVAALQLVSGCIEERIQVGVKPRALCVGVGGGALLSFLRRLGLEVDGVEVDEEVLRIARQYFGLENDDNIPIFLGDAAEVIEMLAKRANRRNEERANRKNPASFSDHGAENGYCSSNGNGVDTKYDAIMVDLDSSDAITGISAPPPEFVKKSVLLSVKALLYDHGIFAINVIPPTRPFYEGLKCDFREVFPELYEIDVGNGENYVLIAAASPVLSSSNDLDGPFLDKVRLTIPGDYIDSIKKIVVFDQDNTR